MSESRWFSIPYTQKREFRGGPNGPELQEGQRCFVLMTSIRDLVLATSRVDADRRIGLLPDDPNPRNEGPSKMESRIKASLLDATKNCLFVAMHAGIQIVAKDVADGPRNGVLRVHLPAGKGILNGNHSYHIFCSVRPDDIPVGRHVEIKIYTGLTPAQQEGMSLGLNSAVQVPNDDMLHLEGYLNPFKDVLEKGRHKGKFEWRW
jgi:hypothetical protein